MGSTLIGLLTCSSLSQIQRARWRIRGFLLLWNIHTTQQDRAAALHRHIVAFKLRLQHGIASQKPVGRMQIAACSKYRQFFNNSASTSPAWPRATTRSSQPAASADAANRQISPCKSGISFQFDAPSVLPSSSWANRVVVTVLAVSSFQRLGQIAVHGILCRLEACCLCRESVGQTTLAVPKRT